MQVKVVDNVDKLLITRVNNLLETAKIKGFLRLKPLVDNLWIEKEKSTDFINEVHRKICG